MVAMQVTSYRKPTLQQWENLMSPAPGQGEPTEVGCRADDPLPQSIDEFRRKVSELDYLPLDPFVASVAGSVGANQIEVPQGETTVPVRVPGYYGEDVEVMMGTHNGPAAPMLLILPGIHSGGDSSHNMLLRKLALERGMNYVALPNSMNAAMLEDKPLYHPGNPRLDALWTRELLGALKEQYPEFFTSVSVAGYSYGALQAANLVRLDEESGNRLIDGGMVAVSPPENLEHSMRQLDELRQSYANGSATIADTGLHYKHDVKKFGYERFMESALSKHGPETNVDEKEIADKYGSRDSLKSLVEKIDTQFGHNRLPMNTEAYKEANLIEKYKMRQEHKQIVDNITYHQLSDGWMSKDRWLAQQGMTPAQLAERYSFSEAIKAVEDTPVLVLSAADDYILSGEDVQTLRSLPVGPLEISRVFEVGGHVGLDWNPAIAETLIDFAVAAKGF
jgi:pimeloyl-ACP methyl ester carboxylesterase